MSSVYCSNCPRAACLITKGVRYCTHCFQAYQKGRGEGPSAEVLEYAIKYLYKLVESKIPVALQPHGTIRALEAALERRKGNE